MNTQEISMHTLWDDLLNVLLRRKRLVSLVTLTIILLVYAGLSFTGDKYEANANLLVKLGRESTEVPLSVEKGDVFSSGVNKEEVNSSISLIRSRHLLEATIDKIGIERLTRRPDKPKSFLKLVKFQIKQVAQWGKKQLNTTLIKIGLRPELEDKELLIILLEKSLHVEREKETNVINLSLKFADPVLASEILNTLIELYLAKHVTVHQHSDSIIIAFEEQTIIHQQILKQLSEKELALKKELAIGNVAQQQFQLVEHISKLDDELMKSDRETNKLKSELTSTNDRLAETQQQILSTTKIQPSTELNKMRNRLAELHIKRSETAAKYQAGSAALTIIDDEIKSITRWMNQENIPEEAEKIMLRNPILGILEANLVNIKLRLSSTKTVLEKATAQRRELVTKLQALNQGQAKLEAIQRQKEVITKRFFSNAARQQEAKTQQLLNQLKVANVSVLTPPSYSWKPVGPKRMLIMLGGIIGGLSFGMALALFLEWTNDILYDEKDFKSAKGAAFLGTLKIQS